MRRLPSFEKSVALHRPDDAGRARTCATKLAIGLLAFLALSSSRLARADSCDELACCKAARQHAQGDEAAANQRIGFWQGETVIGILNNTASDDLIRVYHEAKKQPRLDGYKEMSKSVPVKDETCTKLSLIEFRREATPARVPQDSSSSPLDVLAIAALTGRQLNAAGTQSVKEGLSIDAAYTVYGSAEFAEKAALKSGTHAAAADVVAEAVQILGEIVADRASNAAYQRIRDALLEALGCGDSDSEEPAAGDFPLTCSTLRSLRIQDLATSREALLNALLGDALSLAKSKLPSGGMAPTYSEMAEPALRFGLAALSHPNTGHLAETTRLLVSELIRLAEDARQEGTLALAKDPARFPFTPVVVGVAGLLRCKAAVAGGAFSGKNQACPVEDFVREMYAELEATCADKCEKKAIDVPARQLAASVALQLLMASAPRSEDATAIADQRAKLRGVVEASLDAACFLESRGEQTCRVLSSFQRPTKQGDEHTKNVHKVFLSTTRALLLGAIEGDTNSLLRDTTSALAWFAQYGAVETVKPANGGDIPGKKPIPYKAFRLIGTVLDYSGTYADAEGKTAEQLHEQRKKLLESLVDEMTYRADRGGDWIISLGGSLNVVAGARLPVGKEAKNVFNGPLSLLLGFAVDKIPKKHVGFHMELAPIDLGQYLSFEKSSDSPVDVRKPSAEDLIAPTLVLGIALGRELPFVLGLSGGYNPGYQAEDVSASSGAFFIGFNAGIYVPLFDLN